MAAPVIGSTVPESLESSFPGTRHPTAEIGQRHIMHPQAGPGYEDRTDSNDVRLPSSESEVALNAPVASYRRAGSASNQVPPSV